MMAARTTRAGLAVPFRATHSSCTARANPACHTSALGSCRPALGESIVRVTPVAAITLSRPLTQAPTNVEMAARGLLAATRVIGAQAMGHPARATVWVQVRSGSERGGGWGLVRGC